MDKRFILKNQNWILPTCDSFLLIVSQLCIWGQMSLLSQKPVLAWHATYLFTQYLEPFYWSNSRCCQFQTPPTTWQNTDFLKRTSEKSAKLRITLVRHKLYETHARSCNKRMLIAQDCIKFHRRIEWQSFLVNNFADLSDVVRIKKNIMISFRYWWRLELATSPTKAD